MLAPGTARAQGTAADYQRANTIAQTLNGLTVGLVDGGANWIDNTLVLPGQGHGAGRQFGTRKRNDYFVRHLLGVNPPEWNAASQAASNQNGVGDDALNDLTDWLHIPASEQPPLTNEWR